MVVRSYRWQLRHHAFFNGVRARLRRNLPGRVGRNVLPVRSLPSAHERTGKLPQRLCSLFSAFSRPRTSHLLADACLTSSLVGRPAAGGGSGLARGSGAAADLFLGLVEGESPCIQSSQRARASESMDFGGARCREEARTQHRASHKHALTEGRRRRSQRSLQGGSQFRHAKDWANRRHFTRLEGRARGAAAAGQFFSPDEGMHPPASSCHLGAVCVGVKTRATAVQQRLPCTALQPQNSQIYDVATQ